MAAPPSPVPLVLLDSFSAQKGSRSFSFSGLQRIISTHTLADVVSSLRRVEQEVSAGLHAAGFVSYEAAAAFNAELPASPPGELPLLWFALFRERITVSPGERTATAPGVSTVSPLHLNLSKERYCESVAAIREAIAAGETYQVNFTARSRFSLHGDPFSLYQRICRNQKAPYCAYLDTGRHLILSASPELFFSLNEQLVTMKPMKGTAPRLPRGDQDLAQRERLAASGKERAENLMIVDLVRNDLSRIAETGSVQVPTLFEVETYPTLHQMTSTVTARLSPEIGVTDIFQVLFPCGSVTGAPKRHTMQIINALEDSPRGVYCGAIGYLSPGGEALFSVAIRTAVVDSASGAGELGIGSGITWDSRGEAEFEECRVKSAFLTREVEEFSLIESLRHDRHGYLLLERHLQRLLQSASYFGIPCDRDAVQDALERLGNSLQGIHKVRLVLADTGRFTLEAQPLPVEEPPAMARIALSRIRTDPADPFLYHKTTCRRRYDQERQQHPGCHEVIFLNTRGEVTEGSYTNIVISRGGRLYTPALDCGLLPGVLREELLSAGGVQESVMGVDELRSAEKLWLINSVRGWRECHPPDISRLICCADV